MDVPEVEKPRGEEEGTVVGLKPRKSSLAQQEQLEGLKLKLATDTG